MVLGCVGANEYIEWLGGFSLGLRVVPEGGFRESSDLMAITFFLSCPCIGDQCLKFRGELWEVLENQGRLVLDPILPGGWSLIKPFGRPLIYLNEEAEEDLLKGDGDRISICIILPVPRGGDLSHKEEFLKHSSDNS